MEEKREKEQFELHLEVTVVEPEYQGYGLQYRLFCRVEHLMKKEDM